ncbi:hypothetical protein AMECASPLE_027174, partial [Ameca splendens]
EKLQGCHATVVQQPTVSDPVLLADVGTLQCSVLADFENKMCSEDPRVFWFRAEAVECYPDIIYIDKNKSGECKKRFDTQRSYFYQFSNNIISSDSATYYCAIATCRKILFGNATKAGRETTTSQERNDFSHK